MALRKEPEQRYASVEQLSPDIERHLQGLPVHARRSTLRYRASKFFARHARSLSAAAAAGILFVALTAWYLYELAGERDLARLEAEKAQQTAQVLLNVFSAVDPELGSGEAISARELLDRGAEDIGSQLAGQPAVRATALGWIGQIYTKLGFHDRAEELLTSALETRLRLYGENHAEVAESYEQMAQLRQSQYRFKEAEALHRRALEVRERTFGHEHPLVAHSLERIAYAMLWVPDYSEAGRLLTRALAIQERTLGPDDPALVDTLRSLSLLHDELGDTATARLFAARAVSITERAFGSEHPRLVGPLYVLGRAYQHLGDYRQAASIYQRHLRITERTFGRTNMRVADTLEDLAFVTQMNGDTDKAIEHAREAVELRAKLHGTQDYNYASALVTLANVYVETGQYTEARLLFERAVAIVENDSHNDPRFLAFALTGYGDLHLEIGEHAEALKIYGRALELRQRTYGPEHPAVALTLTKVGTAEMLLGRLAPAEATLRRSVEMNRRLLPPTGARLADAALALGDLLTRTGAVAEAESLLREGLKIREQNLPAAHPDIAVARSLLGGCLTAARRYREAEPLLVDGYRVLSRTEDAGSTRGARAARRVLRSRVAAGRGRALQRAAGFARILITLRTAAPAQRRATSLLRTGLTSMIGVPCTASSARTRMRTPSTAVISTRCKPTGLGRSGERVLNTPARALETSPLGRTLKTSRCARSSQVRTRISVPGRRSARPSSISGSKTSQACGAPSSACRGAASRSVSEDSTLPMAWISIVKAASARFIVSQSAMLSSSRRARHHLSLLAAWEKDRPCDKFSSSVPATCSAA